MAGWSVTMIDRSLRRQFLVLLILVGWLGVGLQTVGQGSFCDPTPGSLPLVETFLAEASTLPAEAGDGAPHEEEVPPADCLVSAPGMPGTSLPRQRYNPVALRTALPEGPAAEIYRPPTAFL